MDEHENHYNSTMTSICLYACMTCCFSIIACIKSCYKKNYERERRRNNGVIYDIEMAAYNFSSCFNKISIAKIDNEDKLCSICLSKYTEEECIYESKICKHHFHFSCINHWLNIKTSCPLCRKDILTLEIH
jgi:hypothetical protein